MANNIRKKKGQDKTTSDDERTELIIQEVRKSIREEVREAIRDELRQAIRHPTHTLSHYCIGD